MERRSFVRQAGLAGVLAAGAAPAVVHAQANVRWRLASSFPKSLDTIFGAAEVFAKKVGELSGGKFQISVHPGGELMPAFGVVDGVQNATVEIAHTAPYYFFGKDETFALGCAIPFGLNSRQMTAWMFEGNGLKLMREFYRNFNIISFPGGNTGAQMGGWYRKPVLWFNWTATVLSLVVCVALVIYVRRTMSSATDHAWWPVVSAFYGLVAIPLCLAVGAGIRRLVFGRREAAKPLEISQDLSKTRF